MEIRPKVFLSHSKRDKEFIIKIADDLRACRIGAWYDDWEIPPGVPIEDKIFKDGIPKCDLFFVYLSKNSIKSDWVMRELDAAFVEQSRNPNVAITTFVDSEATRKRLTPALAKLRSPLFNTDNYDMALMQLIATIYDAKIKNILYETSRKAEERRAKLANDPKLYLLRDFWKPFLDSEKINLVIGTPLTWRMWVEGDEEPKPNLSILINEVENFFMKKYPNKGKKLCEWHRAKNTVYLTPTDFYVGQEDTFALMEIERFLHEKLLVPKSKLKRKIANEIVLEEGESYVLFGGPGANFISYKLFESHLKKVGAKFHFVSGGVRHGENELSIYKPIETERDYGIITKTKWGNRYFLMLAGYYQHATLGAALAVTDKTDIENIRKLTMNNTKERIEAIVETIVKNDREGVTEIVNISYF